MSLFRRTTVICQEWTELITDYLEGALPRRLVRILSGIARFGLVARGIVLCALGYFLCRAAIDGDPTRVQSMGGALRTFSRATFGPALMGTIAFGLGAYGVYLWTLMLLKRRV